MARVKLTLDVVGPGCPQALTQSKEERLTHHGVCHMGTTPRGQELGIRQAIGDSRAGKLSNQVTSEQAMSEISSLQGAAAPRRCVDRCAVFLGSHAWLNEECVRAGVTKGVVSRVTHSAPEGRCIPCALRLVS